MKSALRPDITICPGTTLYDNYAHRPFICSNEDRHKYTVYQAKGLPPKGNTIVGVSCFAVLNIAAHRPIPLEDLSIVVIDRGVRVLDFWTKVIDLIKDVVDKEEFQNNLIDLYYDQRSIWGEGLTHKQAYTETIDQLGVEINQGFSWIARDETFQRIQQIVLSGRLTIYGGDITRRSDMLFLSSELSRMGKKVDLFYISNCHEYIKPTCEALALYTDSIDAICQESRSYLLTTAPRASIQETLQQQIIEYHSRGALATFWHRDECRIDNDSPVESEECFYFPKIEALRDC